MPLKLRFPDKAANFVCGTCSKGHQHIFNSAIERVDNVLPDNTDDEDGLWLAIQDDGLGNH